METEKIINEKESLQIIHEMIAAAQNNIKADAFIFLLWGWLVFIASTTQFILIKINFENSAIVWWLMPLGGIITPIYIAIKNKKNKTRTYVSEFIKYTWIAFTVVLLIIIFFNSMSYVQVLSIIMALYGLGLFLSGGALQFKPLMIGGIFCWLCSIAGFYVQNIYVLLILSAAVMGGYIIPGYLLKYRNRNV